MISTRVVVQDCLFLTLVVVLSFILYIHDLGFYSDDWGFLGTFSVSKDESLTGLFQSAYSPHSWMRPVAIFYLSGMYWLFGPDASAYHLVNAAMLLSGILLFYFVLLELRQGRLLALAVPLVYGLIPHYATDRFWMSASVITLSMALYFLSLYADLRAVRSRRGRLLGWKLLSLLSLLASTLTYEVFLPLFLLNLLIVWYHGQQHYGLTPGKPLSRMKLTVLYGSNLVALIVVVVFKALTTTRLGRAGSFDDPAVWFDPVPWFNHILWCARLLKDAIIVSYGNYGLGLPLTLWKILLNYFDWTIFAVAGGFGLFVFAYLYRVTMQTKSDLTAQFSPRLYLLYGLVIFEMGYVIFLTNHNALITVTGISNRIAIASAVGVALSFVGAIGWVSLRLPSDRVRIKCFCVLVALLCTSGFVIINTLASFWVTAYQREQIVLQDIQQQLPTLPSESILILDGVCPYVGPAVVFESYWDLAGALILYYRDPTLLADVVTPKMEIEEDGLSTRIYWEFYTHYPYGENLFVYHFGRKITYPLPDAEAARLYFQTFNPDLSGTCPPGREGYGVSIF